MRRLLVVLCSLSLLLVACGDDDDVATDDAVDDGPAEDSPADDSPADASDGAPDDGPVATVPVPIGLSTGPEPSGDGSGVTRPEGPYFLFNANGIETDDQVVSFGDLADDAVDAAVFVYGAPDEDTGDQPVGPDCLVPGDTYRRVLFGDMELLMVDGSFSSWLVTGPDPAIQSFIGDATTFTFLVGETTVGDLRNAFGGDVSIADEPPLGPSFYVEDNFGALLGAVSDLNDGGLVETAFAGLGCGE